ARQRQGPGVVAGTVRDHAALRDVRSEVADGVARSAELERAALLEVLALEEQGPASEPVEGGARPDGSDVGPAGEPFASGPDIVEGDGHGSIRVRGPRLASISSTRSIIASRSPSDTGALSLPPRRPRIMGMISSQCPIWWSSRMRPAGRLPKRRLFR